MGIKNSDGLTGINTTDMQILQNQKDGTVTNVLYNACVYSTSDMNSCELHEFLTDLLNGEIRRQPCQRLKGNVKAWLKSIDKLELVMAEYDRIKKELAKAKLKKYVEKRGDATTGNQTYTEKMTEKIEAGKTILTHIKDIDEDALEMRKVSRIIKEHLHDMQYTLQYVYDNRSNEWDYKLVKAEKIVFIPLNKVLAWYYSNFDMTSREYLQSIDGITCKDYPNMSNIAWENLFEVNGKMTSYKVLNEVVKAWLNFYKINKEATDNEIQKIVRYMQEVGIGA